VAKTVLGLGVDLVELDRIELSLRRFGDRLVAKLMDPPEAALLPRDGPERVQALAFSIAAKEAASKAIGTGWSRGVRWRDVVREGETVRLLGRAAEVAARLGSPGDCRLRLELRGNLALGEVRLLS
jgi:holo-[acyl-carrier protein] synthase